MKAISRHAVLGAGGGGQVMAAHLTMNGIKVNLYEHPDYQHVIKPIVAQGGIYLTGVLGRYFAKLNAVTTDMGEAVSDAEVIHIVVPAFAQEIVFRTLVPKLKDNSIVILHPGYLGSLSLGRMINEHGSLKNCIVAEAQTMLYNSRNKDLAHAWAFGIKKVVQLAAFPAKGTQTALNALNSALPYYQAARNVLETFLNNVALVFHPAPSVLNTGLIELSKGNFKYYWDGMTESVAAVSEGVDAERMRIAEALGLDPVSSKDWLIRFYSQYGAAGKSLREVILNCSNYKDGATPCNMKFTYISQDVPYGIMPMISLGSRIGVEAPISKTIADLACYINRTDYWMAARTLANLKLDHLNKDQLLALMQEGE